MPAVAQTTLAQRVKRVAITIPASGSTAVTLYSLVLAGLTAADKHNIIGGRVNAAAADYTAGDSATSLPVTVTSPATYTEPSSNFIQATYVKASANSTTTASVSVWLAGDGNTPF